MKTVYVILAFHAHEPNWYQPNFILKNIVTDTQMQYSTPAGDYLKRRYGEGRDIYNLLLALSRHFSIPLCLEASNELLHQIWEVMPDTFVMLKEAYRTGALYPIYGHAHHTHVGLSSSEEIAQEIEWNMEFLHELMGVPQPKYRGVFPTEDSLDVQKLGWAKELGIDYVIFPCLDPKKTDFSIQGEGDVTHKPFFIERNKSLVALPRNFPISQRIWSPITKFKPEGVKWQGFMLGKYYVFDTEYQEKRFVEFPITYEEAIREYVDVLKTEIEKAPSGGLLLYIQDLELMDFGDIALQIIEEAWKRVLKETEVEILFVTPDQYLEEILKNGKHTLARVKFRQISWAPEIRVLLRLDGHYPPRNSGPFWGHDPTKEIFKETPFIFWEWGKYLISVFENLFTIYDISPLPQLNAIGLHIEKYDFSHFPTEDALALHLRLMKRACNWGWQPTEELQKRPFLHGYTICSLLMESPQPILKPLPFKEKDLVGLVRILEFLVNTRVNYLRSGIEKLEEKGGKKLEGARRELDKTLNWRSFAATQVKDIYFLNESLKKEGEDKPSLLKQIISHLRSYCKGVFMASDHLQRAWKEAGDPEFLVEEMYFFLYDLYLPLYPQIKRAIERMESQKIKEFFDKLPLSVKGMES